jgi:serine/threonine-protein kinase
MLPVGTRVGDYEIEAELGSGGMATVYRARHALLESHCALKVLDPRYRASPEARARFLDEARIQHKHLDHPNIVKVLNVVATAEHAALVMELVDGPALEDVIGELRARPAELRRIMDGVLAGVGHARAAGIVHRDLKPANVLLQRKGDALVPKVSDFGIAKLSAALARPGKRSTQGDHRMGTLGYMSPEQLRRAKDVTARSDIFSLGVMLYELATGALPFDGDNEYEVMDRVLHGRYPPPEERAPGIDPVIARVIRRALAVEAGDRFASCEEMAAALAGAADDPDAEWDAHEQTPLPAVDALAVSAPTSVPTGAPGPSPFRGVDVRSPALRSAERALVPAGAGLVAGLAVALVAIAAGAPVVGALLGLAAGAGAAMIVDHHRQKRQFRDASTILVSVEAQAGHRARLAEAMRDLGFDASDETEDGTLHPIAARDGGAEARTFQVRVPNRAALDALYERCQRELRDPELPPVARETLDSEEGFAAQLARLLWDRRVTGVGGYSLVEVLQWHRPR